MSNTAPESTEQARTWRSRRHLWLIASSAPGLILLAWFLVFTTGLTVFWWLGPLVAFGIGPILEYLIGSDPTNPSAGEIARIENGRFYRWAVYLYVPNQYLALAFACWLWAGGGWLTMSSLDKLGLTATVGLCAGLGINAAHEMGHRREPAGTRLARAALAQSWYGHFHVEHIRGHHVRVGTPEDSASAWMGQSFYAFLPRSVVLGMRSAWRFEARRLRMRGASPWTHRNEVISGFLLSACLYLVLVVWFGMVVLPWLIGQAIIGIALLETVNYIEHYGLRRHRRPDGRYEPVRAVHSWNSDTIVGNLVLYQLQRHSDHHINPARPYQALRHREQAPQLPAGYATMVPLAWLPPLWRRVMDKRVLAVQGAFGGEFADRMAAR